MKITDVRCGTFSIKSDIRNSVIDFSEMTVAVVELVSDQYRDGKPVAGYGFNSNGRYGQEGLLRERFIPRLRGADPASLVSDDGSNFDPIRIADVLMRNEKPGGHGERAVAVGTVDMAAWDLAAKIDGVPVCELLAARFGAGPAAAGDVWTYAAGGYYYPEGDLASLQNEMLEYVNLGYQAVKMKIGGASLEHDMRRVEAVLAVLPGGVRLAVDANGRFDADLAVRYAKALQDYGLLWYEEPVDPQDYAGLSRVADLYDGCIATGENLMSWREVANLARYGGMRPDRDVLQMDPVLSYGVGEYLRMIDVMEEHGWSKRRFVPHGGHQLNLAIASGIGLGGCESYPAVFGAFGGFGHAVTVTDGFTRPQLGSPGLGLEASDGFQSALAGGLAR